jgi:peptidoglycan lytic transglycosylase G
MSSEWQSGDPFADPDDPAAREREQRRLEREEKRAKKGKKGGAGGAAGDASPSQQRGGSVEASPAAPQEPSAGSAAVEQTPPDQSSEEEFWDEGHDEGLPPEETASPPPPPVAPRSGGRSGGRGGSGGGVLGALRRHPFRVVGAVVAVVLVWFLWSLFQPFHGDGSGRVAVNVPKGSSVSEVGDLLADKGVIDNSTFFQIRVTLDGKRSDLYAGNFTLAHGMSYGAAIDALSKPPVKRVTTVTIPEGYSRPQAAQLVEEDGVPGSYTKATVRSKYLNPAEYGGKGAKDLEGFLFPDTFELKPNAPVADLVQLQLEDFKRRIKGVNMKYAKSKNLTVFDVLTIASMIEREAGVAKQRKLVASVVYNRLHEGMPLGIDATIRFATGNYSEPLTESQLATSSPYNTRTNVGLPPGPINSPGLEAIEAAAHPAKTDYLFYVNNPDSCNELSFAKTDAEFEADVQKYEKAREANGGNAPSTCGK